MVTASINSKANQLNAVIEDLRNGRDESLKYIFKQYSALFTSIARSYSSNPEVVKDLVQEGLVKIYYNIDKYRNGNFEGWMKRIITNYCIDYTRSAQAKHDKLAMHSNLNNDYEENTFQTTGKTDSKLHTDDLEEAIETLPQGYKKVLKYYCIEGYSHKEIGEMLGIEASSSRSQLMKAKNKLKNVLLERGIFLG